jgi:hypothetical protein
MEVVVIDAENVRRSCWPNLSLEELVERAPVWGEREGHDLRGGAEFVSEVRGA